MMLCVDVTDMLDDQRAFESMLGAEQGFFIGSSWLRIRVT